MPAAIPSSGSRLVAITGASGLIGAALSEALRGRGDQVLHLVRRAPRASGDLPAGVREAQWEPGSELDPAVLDGVDGVVHLAGAGIGDRRWSESRKQELVESRLSGTATIAQAVAARAGEAGAPLPGEDGHDHDQAAGAASAGRAPRLLSGSAIGYYGERGSEVLTEDSDLGDGFLADLCRDWEAATWPAERAGVPVAHLRTGIVLTPHGGALGKLLPLARAGLAGPLGGGDQYWPWITLHDHVRAMLFLLERPDLRGPVNLTGPHPDTQTDVVKALASELHRPAVVPAPTIALRLVLGEMAGEILGSARVLPAVLTEAGFTFDHPDLPAAMAWLSQERAAADAADA